MFMADNPLNQSHELYEGERLDNNHINNTLLDEETTIHSQSELMDDPSRIDYANEEERKNDSNDKESLHVDIAFDRNLDNKEIKVKKHQSHLRGFLKERERQILTFHCFGDKRVDLSKDDVASFIRRKFDEDVRNFSVSASVIVQEVIRKLCMSEFGFEPCMVKVDSFSLVGIEVDAEGRREVAVGTATLEGLYKFESLQVTRVKRVVELSKYYTELQERSKELEILQILSPDQRDLVEVIERGRTYGELKEKLLSYYYQMVGKVILVSYHNFKVLENKRKIGDVSDRIIQIYQEKTWQFQDNNFRKRNNIVTGVASCPCLVAAEEHSPTTTEELLINDSLIKGSLYLQVRKNQLMERFHGGFLGYLGADRVTARSLMTLTAIKIEENHLYLQFKFKASSEIVVYEFSSRALLTQLLKAVLAVVRKYQHRVEVMQ